MGFPCKPGTPGCRPRGSKFQGRGLSGEAGRQVEGPVHWSRSKNLRTQEPRSAGGPCTPVPPTGFLGLLGQRPGSHLSPLRSDEQSWAQIRTSQVTRPVGGRSGVPPPAAPSPVLLPLSAHTPAPTPHALPALQTQGHCSTSGPPAPLIALGPGAPRCSPRLVSQPRPGPRAAVMANPAQGGPAGFCCAVSHPHERLTREEMATR